MAADFIAAHSNSAQQVRVIQHIARDDKKCPMNIVFAQYIQYLIDGIIIAPVIKSQKHRFRRGCFNQSRLIRTRHLLAGKAQHSIVGTDFRCPDITAVKSAGEIFIGHPIIAIFRLHFYRQIILVHRIAVMKIAVSSHICQRCRMVARIITLLRLSLIIRFIANIIYFLLLDFFKHFRSQNIIGIKIRAHVDDFAHIQRGRPFAKNLRHHFLWTLRIFMLGLNDIQPLPDQGTAHSGNGFFHSRSVPAAGHNADKFALCTIAFLQRFIESLDLRTIISKGTRFGRR